MELKELSQRLKEDLKEQIFISGEIKFIVKKFFIRKEKRTGDIILYIKPSVEPQTIKERNKLEKVVYKNLRERVDEVIIPFIDFWDLMETKENQYEKELYNYLLTKFRKQIFKVDIMNNIVRFSVHPYKLKGGILLIDVRDFKVMKPDGSTRDMNYKPFKETMENKVLDSIGHLGIKQVKIMGLSTTNKDILENKNYL